MPHIERSRTVVIFLVLALSGLLVGCSTAKSDAQAAAEKFLNALAKADVGNAAALTSNPSSAQTVLKASLADLGKGSLKVASVSTQNDTKAIAKYHASWKIPQSAKPWSYDATLTLSATKNKKWQVQWSPSVLYPQLATNEQIAVQRIQPTRADLLDSTGKPLFAPTTVVIVGLQPSKVQDIATVSATLAKVLNVDAAKIQSDFAAATPDAFVPVVTLREPDYLAVKSLIYDLQGTVFQTTTQLLTQGSGWGRALLGVIGPATKEIIDASSGRIKAGDQTGLSGLQKSYDKQLSGTPGIQVVRTDGGSNPTVIDKLQDPIAGKPVTLTLDSTIQTAAENALSTIGQQAAIVALQPSTGKILAVANSATAQGNIAMTGKYPAGSSFKIVTYLAAYTADPSLSPDFTIACPGTITVNGKQFENENKFDEGTISLREAFARSCNTSAIELAQKLGNSALPDTAKSLGMGADWQLPTDSFSGSLDVPAGPTDLAAAAIGQGTVAVSPLAMAVFAEAAATGTPMTPSLDAAAPGIAGKPIDPTALGKVQAGMQAVVAQPYGTAYLLHDLPGAIAGKTGTAEFGTQTPPQSHSWFVGYRGDVAFAIFVYDGGASQTGAVPIAKTFLAAFS
ncbi:MAG: penicillin-binding transpeptidase domain-containing protein [Antricoccus sp.]